MLTILRRLFEPKSNTPEAACMLAEALGLKITNTTFAEKIEEHPNSNSLLSISDVLAHYHVENFSLQLPAEYLAKLSAPFIASVKAGTSRIPYFSVVRKIDSGMVFFHDPEKHEWLRLPLEQFQARYNGTVLLVEKESLEPLEEPEYEKKLSAEKRDRFLKYLSALTIPGIVFITAIITIVQRGMGALLPVIYLLLTLAGAITGALLIFYELDRYNPVLKEICGGGKKLNCNAILQSKASRVAGISWSIIGTVYFSGQLYLMIFAGISSPAALGTVAWMNLLTLPYVFFSIYYQSRVAKQWCRLCLCVQCLLVLQFMVGLIGHWYHLLSSALHLQWLVGTTTVFSFLTIALMMLMSALEKAKKGKSAETELQQMKHNPEVFESLLVKQKKLTESADGLGITLGNPNAKYKIIKVCNPYCGPCATAHADLEALLQNNDNLQLQIIFTASNDEKDIKNPPVRHLMAIAQRGNKAITKQSLDDWYLVKERNYAAFAKKYPLFQETTTHSVEMQTNAIDAMTRWCKKIDVKYTPTFFVSLPGGTAESAFHQLPDQYKVLDLQYFLADKE